MPVTRTRLLDAEEAAWVLCTTPHWVLTAARAGQLPAVRVGRAYRFDADDLQVWIAAHRTAPVEASPVTAFIPA